MANTGNMQGTDDERIELLKEAYEGEILGEALFAGLECHAHSEHQQRACRRLAEVEAVTGELLLPVVARHRVSCDSVRARERGQKLADEAKGDDWLVFWGKVIPLAEAALAGMRRLRRLSDEVDAAAIDQLVAHEEAVIAFARREISGAGDSIEPLDRYLAAQRSAADTL